MWIDKDREELNQMNFNTLVHDCIAIRNRGKNALRYLEVYGGFDIETTTTESHHGFMYHWQLSLNHIVIFGTRWFEFNQIIEKLKRDLKLRKSTRIILWVANLSFEFSFMAKHLNITNIFAKEQRQPMIAVEDDCIEFRDCLQITGGSLESLAKDFCKTRKMKGDLDYDVIRNYEDGKNLTEKEEKYCENDVVILSEFSEYIFKTYIIPDKYVPLTKTGLLRKAVKNGVDFEIQKQIRDCYPDQDLYDKLMQFVFRGGFVHANIFYVGRKIEGITGIDLTSSYPARMNQSYFPVSRFVKRNPSEFGKYINTHCCLLHVVIWNMRSTTPHSIESRSKCVDLIGAVIDNGRISSCTKYEAWLTELDFDLICRFYEFNDSDLEVKELYTAVRGDLPEYLMKPINEAYIKKATLKKSGKNNTPEYAIAKAFVNSGYGLTVQKQIRREITYQDGIWGFDYSSFNYDKEVMKASLLPQWGCWVSAHARHELLLTVYNIEMRYRQLTGDKFGCVLYCDTDSIKLIHYDLVKDIVEQYNNERVNQMKVICKKKNLPFEYFNDLGSYDLEYSGVSGKFLGAKRYIITEDEHTSVTVAGLPKRVLPDYCEKTNQDIYKVFSDGMMLGVDVAMKNAHAYFDSPYEEVVNGVKMRELSGCGIFKVPFTLKLDEFFAGQISRLQQENEKYEIRTDNQDIYGSDRILEIAGFMIDYNIHSIRSLAKEFHESEYIIIKMIQHELPYINDEMYQQCMNLLKGR